MKKSPAIIWLQTNGPNGLSRLEPGPADVHGMPQGQGACIYLEDENSVISVGVWDTTSMQEAFGPYLGDEFIMVLESSFKMLDATGQGLPAKTDQSFVVRNGAPGSWKQISYLKKFYITFLESGAPT